MEGAARRTDIADAGDFLRCNGTVGANHARSDTERAVAEEVADEDVDEAKNAGDDARGDDNLPERHAEGLLGGRRFIEVTKNRDTDDDHKDAKSHEARGWAEERPVAGEVGFEERELRNDEEY